MCESIKHRGPDSTNFYVDDNFCLGVDRLKVIDLETGDQPIHNEDGSLQVVHNGEIYNYVELREALESKGHRFYTDSDTETIVHAYEQWGTSCLEKFRGMFAFALLDAEQKRLILARDRFGKKPIYYALVGETLLFSSELRAILLFDEVSPKIDYNALDLYFTYSFIPSPYTIYEGIHKLPPASFLTYQGGRVTVDQYWDPYRSTIAGLNEDQLIDQLYGLLMEAVRIRLRSDVPIAAYLSGGIDSSSVVAMMRRATEAPISTFTVSFSPTDKSPYYAREVAESLGTDHNEVFVEPDVFHDLPKLVWHFGEPFADSSMIPTYYVSEAARRRAKVVITGDGGDELFMGYDFFSEPRVYRLYKAFPRSARRILLRTADRVPLPGRVSRGVWQLRNTDYDDRDPTGKFIARISHFPTATLRNLYSQSVRDKRRPSDTEEYMRQFASSHRFDDFASEMSYVHMRSLLAEGMLVKLDRMSMANSLEARSPLLDHVLYEFVGGLPSTLKLNGNVHKVIFKRMATKKGLVSDRIALRPKVGFGVPLEKWFGSGWRDLVTRFIDETARTGEYGILDPIYLRKLAREPNIHAPRLFLVLVFLLWQKISDDGRYKVHPPSNPKDLI
jgi:asparagine synthase (glutamine-hydrolysing)